MKYSKSKTDSTNRRQFIKRSGGIALLIGASGILPQFISCKNPSHVAAQLKKHQITSWIKMSEDGKIVIYNPAAEMGQGSMTSLPAIFAEEMDANWDNVQVEFSPQISNTYGSDGWGSGRKIMLSAGSRVTKGYYSLLRKAGAQARFILMHNAARIWNVPIDGLSTSDGHVLDENSGMKIAYGDLVKDLVVPEEIPDFELHQLKNPKDFKFIGHDLPRTDIPAKTNGSAQFAIDVILPGMLYGVLERGRVHGAKPTLTNSDEIMKLPGILHLVSFDYAIGIIGERIENVLAAKSRLEIEWSDAIASTFNSEEIYDEYKRVADKERDEKVVVEKGNTKKAIRSAARLFSADYKNDYVYHAQMEPLNAVVQIAEDGASATAWVGSQQGFDSKLGIPEVLDMDPEKVHINLQYLGGGFGRRSMTDFVKECTILAKEVPGQPIKLMWTREDDLTYGAFRPMSLQRLQAGIDSNGRITGFSHTVIGDGDNLLASGIRNDHYEIPNQYAALKIIPHGIRLKHWRGVGHGPNKFAIESMIDQIAHSLGKDPIDFRRTLMSESPKALATLNKAAAMSGWNQPNLQGRAKGVAFIERSGTLSTGVCEISLDENTGKIRVHYFWSASDAGVVIQPDNVKAQMEGGIIMGMSSVFKERISIIDGAVQQSNFDDYELLRMADIPERIETAIIKSDGPPQGVGESGTPLVAGAVANAFLALTGKHLRHLPFTPERVLEALNS